jgi:tripartite-type tricarboxylate transporter receptor subunit TctC
MPLCDGFGRMQSMRVWRVHVLAVMLVLGAAEARSDSVADFYKGRQVNLIVGYGTGGGYDVYGRLFAHYFGRYIPGNPTVVVQNMPGAGSLRALNFLYNSAPKDGTAIAIFGRDLPLIGIIGRNTSVRFDPLKLTWLGTSSSYADDAYLLFIRKDAVVKSIEEARRPGGPPLVLGGSAEGSSGNDIPIIAREALGLNIKLVSGYPDSNALNLAVDRKEVDGRFVGISATASSHPQWFAADSPVAIHLQFGRATRHPRFPDVPTARELALNERARALVELAELPYRLSRPFAAPPDVPQDRARALQAAFLAVHRDAMYLEEAGRMKIDVSPLGGEEVVSAIEDIARAPADVLETMKKVLAEGKGG